MSASVNEGMVRPTSREGVGIGPASSLISFAGVAAFAGVFILENKLKSESCGPTFGNFGLAGGSAGGAGVTGFGSLAFVAEAVLLAVLVGAGVPLSLIF